MIDAFCIVIGATPVPEWMHNAMRNERIWPATPNPPLNRWASDGMMVKAPDRDMLAMPGDWIIRTEADELYAVKAVDFERTYDTVKLQGTHADLVIIDELDP